LSNSVKVGNKLDDFDMMYSGRWKTEEFRETE